MRVLAERGGSLRRSRSLTVLAIPAFLLLLAAGCTSGGGTGSLGGGSAVASAAFGADQPNPGPDSVALAQGQSANDVVTVLVTVTDVDGVFGGAFDLTWDAARARFLGWSAGALLEQGGHTPTYQLDGRVAGRLIFGASRQGGAGPVDAVGTVVLVELRFRLSEVGSTPLAFQSEALFDDQVQPQPIPGISWFAGNLIGS